MTRFNSPWISLIFLFPIHAFSAPDSTYSVEEEIDVHYKKQVPIYLQHDLGDVTITGWNQDMIRVKLKKSGTAGSEDAAKETFKKFSLVSLETPTTVEIRVGTPPGTDLLTKLRNRNFKKGMRVDLEIRAPAALPISIVMGSDRKLKLSSWRGKTNITGKNNSLELSKLRSSSPLNLNCPNCSLLVTESEFSGSILVGDQKTEIKKTKAAPQPLLIFSQKGEVTLENTEGDFQVRTQSGDVAAVSHVGGLQVQSDSGKLNVDNFEGDLDVQTQTGEMKVSALKILHQMELKNKVGPIEITLPREFTGEVNLQSVRGNVFTDFLVSKDHKKTEALYGPELKGRLAGKIGKGGSASVTASSENSEIDLKQKGRQ